MKQSIPFSLALAALLLTGCLSGANHQTQPIPVASQDALAKINAFRAANGLSSLSLDSQLTTAAARQSQAMAAADEMGHRIDGRLGGRVKAVGYQWQGVAENLGMGYLSFDAALEGWKNSPGHRENLLRPEISEAGIAAARSYPSTRNYWTLILADPR